jgi:phage/plasmid-associated DNA primase
MWRRPMLIGFDQVIQPDQQDKMLPSKLKQEGSGTFSQPMLAKTIVHQVFRLFFVTIWSN